jgi:hypothetical protein
MKFEHYESGSLYGVRYTFREGERLWPHAHAAETADQAHNIIVLQGSVIFDGAEKRLLTAGDIYDFDGSLAHSIFAPEPAVILNLMLHGKPASFADYTNDQKRGEI